MSIPKHVRSRRLLWVVIACMAVALPGAVLAAGGDELWPVAGHDNQNSRYQKVTKISPGNAANLHVLWQFDTGGDVSATPAVDGNTLYFPDSGGNLWALSRATGAVVWHKTMADYGLPAGDYARTTPVIAGNKLIFGDQGGKVFTGTNFAGAHIMAVSKQTGELLWKTSADSHPTAIVTQSAVWDEGANIVYVGVASNEEGAAAFVPGYQCCSFRGSVLALNANTGAIVWKTYTAPTGYSGNAVWGSTPVIDKPRKSLYVTTGNNYTVPDSVSACVLAANGDPEDELACIAPDDHFDSILALDPKTGAVKWAHRALPFDAWVVSCILDIAGNNNCPNPSGPDYDFGQGAALFTAQPAGGKKIDLLGAGQKSGDYWALNPDTGAVVWKTHTGPGGTAGGLQWGSATDGKQIFTANANSDHKPWDLLPTGGTTNGGIWSALDAATGAIQWQVANTNWDPNPFGPLPSDTLRAGSTGPVTLANGVVFGCSLDRDGHMYAFDAATGAVLWDFESGGSCASGPAVVDGTVYWGSGYGYGGFFGVAADKMFAFVVE